MFTGLLDTTFTIQNRTLSADGYGGRSSSYANGNTFQGRLSEISGRTTEAIRLNREDNLRTYVIYANHDVAVDETKRVTMDSGSRVFEVVGVRKPSNLAFGIGHLEISVGEKNA